MQIRLWSMRIKKTDTSLSLWFSKQYIYLILLDVVHVYVVTIHPKALTFPQVYLSVIVSKGLIYFNSTNFQLR